MKRCLRETRCSVLSESAAPGTWLGAHDLAVRSRARHVPNGSGYSSGDCPKLPSRRKNCPWRVVKKESDRPA